MKKTSKIIRKPDSDFWKEMEAAATQFNAEKAATEAAERARKETLERAARYEAAQKAYLDSIKYYDDLTFDNSDIIGEINKSKEEINSLQIQLSEVYLKKKNLFEKLKRKCSHKMVLERRTSWTDEYGDWHEGNSERKCIECLLEEESTYPVESRSYGSNKKFDHLEKSQVVNLRRIINGVEYELEYDDIK